VPILQSRASGGAAAALAAYEGGQVTGRDEGAIMIDHGLHVLAHVLDDIGPGAGDLILVVAGQAGHVVRGQRGVADHYRRLAGRAHARNGVKSHAQLAPGSTAVTGYPSAASERVT